MPYTFSGYSGDAEFSIRFRNASFRGFELVTGTIIRNGTWRKPWSDEAARTSALQAQARAW
jgi:hypothetical protein